MIPSFARSSVLVLLAAAACGPTGEAMFPAEPMTTSGEPSDDGSSTSDGGDESTSSTSGSSSESGVDESSTGVPEPVCGDGVIDEGEACDDGPANAETAACLPDCAAAACGDGL